MLQIYHFFITPAILNLANIRTQLTNECFGRVLKSMGTLRPEDTANFGQVRIYRSAYNVCRRFCRLIRPRIKRNIFSALPEHLFKLFRDTWKFLLKWKLCKFFGGLIIIIGAVRVVFKGQIRSAGVEFKFNFIFVLKQINNSFTES